MTLITSDNQNNVLMYYSDDFTVAFKILGYEVQASDVIEFAVKNTTGSNGVLWHQTKSGATVTDNIVVFEDDGNFRSYVGMGSKKYSVRLTTSGANKVIVAPANLEIRSDCHDND